MFNVPAFYRVKTGEKKINVEAPRLSLRFGFCNLICGVGHPTPFMYIEPLIVFFFFSFLFVCFGSFAPAALLH